MSKDEGLIERPKVRFCQPSENLFGKCELPKSLSGEAVLQGISNNKPRVRSVVTLDSSSRLEYKNGNFITLAKGNVESKDMQNSLESLRNAVLPSEANICRPPLSSHNNQTISKSQKPSLCENNSEESGNGISTNSKSLTVTKAPPHKGEVTNVPYNESGAYVSKSNKNSLQTDSCSSGIISEVKTGAKPKTCISKIVSKYETAKAAPSAAKKLVTKSVTGFNQAAALPKNTVCRNNASKMHNQKKETSDKSSLRSGRGITSSAKTVSCSLQPSKSSNKTWKVRLKSTPVKKTILRDVNVCSTNVYVGPGTARHHSQTSNGPTRQKKAHTRPDIVSGEKLSRPEYNSIMCTIEELRRVQSEKLVTDIEQLPLVYRNLVNEKVSATLDFPPNEAIYQNLVDLSVNENQLPSRLTRSRDPEPRHKDIVPQLSDFFTPSYLEEYCSVVQIRPSSPEVVLDWSAFVISDKIFGWKHDMDQCY